MASPEAQDRVTGASACPVSGEERRVGDTGTASGQPASGVDTRQAYVSQIPNDGGAPSPRLFQSLPNTRPCAVGKVWQEVPGCSMFPAARCASVVSGSVSFPDGRSPLKVAVSKGGFRRPETEQMCLAAVCPWTGPPDDAAGGPHSWFSWPGSLRCLHGSPTAVNLTRHLFNWEKGRRDWF